MKTRTITAREGEDCGPIDWEHEIARDMPEHWRDAEQNPGRYRVEHGNLASFRLIALRMYDGWPYWTPRPAIFYMGPLGPEWEFFDSYGVTATSIFMPGGPTTEGEG